MPRKVSSTKKVSRKRAMRKVIESVNTTPAFEPDFTLTESAPVETAKKNRSAVYGVIFIVLVIIGIILFRNGMIVAAIVDGKPIFSWQLSSQLMHQYGKQTLDAMVTERMINAEAAKNGATVTQNAIDQRETDMLKQFGGNVKLQDLLNYQGLTKNDLDQQIKVQLEVENILSKDIKISDTDIANYLASNSAKFTATDAATLKADAQNALMQEDISQKIQPWFNDLKAKTKVIKFIN